MNKIKFNEDFTWGTASSGPQSEGFTNKKNKSIWDVWFEQDPGMFYQGVGPGKTTDVYNEFEQDVTYMKEMGLDSFRTSIQWSRIYKDFETFEVDEDAVRFYSKYFKKLKENGISVYANLFHFDMPNVLFEKYEGFQSREVATLYSQYAKKCFELFDEYVDMWITFNEPMGYARESYHNGRIYPCDLNMNKMMIHNYNTILANALSVKVHKSLKLNSRIGIVVDCLPPIARSQNEHDLEAARVADLLTNRMYLDPCVLGKYSDHYFEFINENGFTIDIRDEDLELLEENTIDFVGINYYQPMRVKAPDFAHNENAPMQLNWFYEEYEKPGCRMNEYRGWEIFPKALYEIGIRMRDDYNNIDWFISENGMGVGYQEENRHRNSEGMIEDDYRIEFLEEHLYWLQKVIEDGSNCFGYHMWTFIDNWSWINAYKNRYGFIEYNIETGERKRKKSSYWMEQLAKNNEIELRGDYE